MGDSSPAKPLTEHEAKVYARAGLTESAAIQWRDRGIGPYWAEKFLAMGFVLHEAALATDAGFGPAATRALLEKGISLADLHGWAFAAGDHELAVWALERGIDARGTAEIHRQFLSMERDGATRKQCQEWFDKGYDLRLVQDALAAGIEASQIDGDYKLLSSVPDRAEQQRWRIASKWINDPARAIGADLTPLEAICGAVTHDQNFEAPTLVADQWEPRLSCADGSDLPQALNRFRTKAAPLSALRDIGFEVIERDSGRMFRDEFPDAVIIGYRSARASSRPADFAHGMLRIREQSSGDWLVEFLRGVDAPDQTVLDLDAALGHIEGVLGNLDAYVSSVSARSLPDSELICLVSREGIPTTDSLTVNTKRVSCRRVSGSRIVVPDDPGAWPSFIRLTDGVWAIGDLVYIGADGSDSVPVGKTDSLKLDDLLPRVWAEIPALIVTRYRPGETVEETKAFRESLTTFTIRDRDGGHTRIRAESVYDLLRSKPSLAAVSRDCFTEYVWSAAESISGPLIASYLTLTGSRTSLTELIDGFGAQADDLPEWAQSLEDSEDGEFRYLPVRVNSHHMIELPIDDTDEYVPLLAGVSWEDPEFFPLEHWATCELSEEASMVSGTDWYELWLVREGVTASFEKLDERGTRIWARSSANARVDVVFEWIDHTADRVGLDLPMLATEQLIGDSDIAYASEFDDDGSPTCCVGMSFAIADPEIPGFLELLAQAKREDCILAIENPSSPAGMRRRTRLAVADDVDDDDT